MDKFAFDQAIEKIILFARACNFFVDQKAPWTLKKEHRVEEMNMVLSTISLVQSTILEWFLFNNMHFHRA